MKHYNPCGNAYDCVMSEPWIDPGALEAVDTAWHLGLTDRSRAQLETYSGFLAGDGVAGGGIGPHEVDRLFDRHIADSLTFVSAAELERTVVDPPDTTVLDIGSGVGLPGIPIAIVRPRWQVTLLDRSQRRTDLASRAIRMCHLDNVRAVAGDVTRLDSLFDVVTFRASLTLDAALSILPGVLGTEGVSIFALSRRADCPTNVEEVTNRHPAYRCEVVDGSGGMLDTPAWLLRISPI